MEKDLSHTLTPPRQWHCGSYRLNCFEPNRPLIMAIMNITEDSFSGDGHVAKGRSVQEMVDTAFHLVELGADILDIGPESTRPGSLPVDLQIQIDRVCPLIEALCAAGINVPISIDAWRTPVVKAAVEAGASIVNDINGVRDEGMAEYLGTIDAGVVVMHMQGVSQVMQVNPQYDNLCEEIKDFLLEQTQKCLDAGVAPERIMLDYGIGYGKTLQHNVTLLQKTSWFNRLGYPFLVGLSRKSMLGLLTGEQVPANRVAATVAANLYAAFHGAAVIRVHDVKEARDSLTVWQALCSMDA